jgi:hypothetical protein
LKLAILLRNRVHDYVHTRGHRRSW